MKLNVEVETDAGAPLLAHMLLTSVPNGVTIHVEPFVEGRGGSELPVVLTFALSVGGTVALDVLANWLYDKLKGPARVLRIDRIEVTLDRGEIHKVLVEHIEERE